MKFHMIIWSLNAMFTRIHGKSGISIIPPGMAEKTRKCGRIPPKAEWLARLQLHTGSERKT